MVLWVASSSHTSCSMGRPPIYQMLHLMNLGSDFDKDVFTELEAQRNPNLFRQTFDNQRYKAHVLGEGWAKTSSRWEVAGS